jgi:dTDP-glucose pyrophosphorylase
MAREIYGVLLASDVDEKMEQFKVNVPRGMLEIGGKSILIHQIELMRNIGIKDFIFLVKHRKELIENYFEDGEKFGVSIKYVQQNNSLGLAHAIGQLEKHIDSPFILSLSSIFLLPKNFNQLLELADLHHAAVTLAVQNAPDPDFSEIHYGVILHSNKMVKRVVEKPRHIMGDLKGCGIYYFEPVIFDAIRRTPRTAMRDQYEIADSIQILIDDGFTVCPAEVIEWYKHINSLSDLEICRVKYASLK